MALVNGIPTWVATTTLSTITGTLTVDNYSLTDGTILPPTDVCPNIAGNQATVPVGMIIDGGGNCVTPPSGGANLILNPSLETGTTTPTNWASGKWGTNTATFTYPVTPAQDGSKAAKVVVSGYTSGDAKWFFNNVNVTAGTTYTFSDYYQSTATTRLVARYTTAGN
ncbi:MAG: hypothetical protein RL545_635, partial [Actinomycetota bacterium]